MTRPDEFLKQRDVTSITKVPRSTIYAWIKRGCFPKPLRIGPRTAAWRASEIQRWIETRHSA